MARNEREGGVRSWSTDRIGWSHMRPTTSHRGPLSRP